MALDFGNNEKYENVFKLCTDQLQSCAEYINKYLDEGEKQEELDQLKETAQGYCTTHFDYEKGQFALNKAKQSVKADNNVDLKAAYEEIVQNDTRSCMFSKYNFYNKLFSEDENDESVFETTLASVESESVEYENLGDSLMCSQVFKPPIDPITKQQIKDPSRNTKCGHVYEYETILSFINIRGKRKCKCPYIGCDNIIMLPRLIKKDPELKVQIEEYNSKHK